VDILKRELNSAIGLIVTFWFTYLNSAHQNTYELARFV